MCQTVKSFRYWYSWNIVFSELRKILNKLSEVDLSTFFYFTLWSDSKFHVLDSYGI